MSENIGSKDKVEALAQFIKLQSLLESKRQTIGTTSVPVLMVDAAIVQTMMEHISSTNQLLTKLIKHPTDLWLTHEQALEFFGVSENTLRGYSNRGWLACSVVDRKKYYHMSDIEKFLMHPENRKQAFQFNK